MVGELKEVVNALEHSVNRDAFASMISPSFDHSLVVAVDPKVSARTDRP